MPAILHPREVEPSKNMERFVEEWVVEIVQGVAEVRKFMSTLKKPKLPVTKVRPREPP